MTNFQRIEKIFQEYESPELFYPWNYLYTVASCLGRKVWFQEGDPVYPNIFLVFVGDAAVGKSRPAKKLGEMLRGLMYTHTHPTTGHQSQQNLVEVAPQSVTLERFYQVLQMASRPFFYMKGDKKIPKMHASVSFILADEMGMLLKKGEQTKNLVLFLNGGYDCMSKFEYETKNSGSNVIINMCLNFLGCCTPSWINENLSTSELDNGWASRVFFVNGASKRKRTSFFTECPIRIQCLKDIEKHCRVIAQLKGEVTFTEEAKAYFDDWYQRKYKTQRINNDPKLNSYYERKRIHVWKIAMLMHFAEHTDMVITLDDLKAAFRFLAETEIDMHKALQSINHNPVGKVADDILELIKLRGSISRIQIIDKTFHTARGGVIAINDAIEYLTMTEKIELNSQTKLFSVVKKVVPVNFGIPEELKESETAEEEPLPEGVKVL